MKRENRIDFLRGVGLLCIILAHVGPPGIIFQIRNFDVPLMVLVAGSAFLISSKKKSNLGYIEYIKNRFIRLVIPTWIFLSIFFILTLVASLVMHKPYPFSSHTIFASFLLLRGIGFVWIIRIFLLVSLIAPFILRHNKFIKDTPLSILVLYLIYEVLFRYFPNSNQYILNIVLNDIFYMIIPYGIIFFMGTRLYDMKPKNMLIASIFAFLLFFAYAIFLYKLNGHFIPTQKYKYPPTAYYILYAMSVSIGLYWLSQTKFYRMYIPGKNYVAFLGRTSMWIYLWHIFILYLIRWSHISINFILKYIVVLSTAVIFAIVQNFLLNKLLIVIDSQEKRKLLKTIFCG